MKDTIKCHFYRIRNMARQWTRLLSLAYWSERAGKRRYERWLRQAQSQYSEIYARAISLCPSKLISWALDEVRFGPNPHPEEIEGAAEFLEDQIELALQEGDCNELANNRWDPSCCYSADPSH